MISILIFFTILIFFRKLKNAEVMIYKRKFDNAEEILLQANPPLIYHAVKMYIDLYQWDRALQIASSVKTSKDDYYSLILHYRATYLRSIRKKEQIEKLQNLFKKHGVISQSQASTLETKLKSKEEM